VPGGHTESEKMFNVPLVPTQLD